MSVNVVELADKRPRVNYTVRLSAGWDGSLRVWVEDVSDDDRSRASVAYALREAANQIEAGSKMPKREISISLRDRVATLNGEPLAITHMFDCFNESTEDFADVVSIVAGPMANGKWLASAVSEEERAEAAKVK